MATFLLTGKAQKTFKKTPEPIPQIIPHFDGWYVDILIVRRKKTVLVTHEKTFMSFVGYLTEIGGAPKVSDWFLKNLENFMRINRVVEIQRVMNLLSKPSTFHKTRSRKAIGHMTDFKHLILNGGKASSSGEQEDLARLSSWLHDVPVRIQGNKYNHPKDLFLELVSVKDN